MPQKERFKDPLEIRPYFCFLTTVFLHAGSSPVMNLVFFRFNFNLRPSTRFFIAQRNFLREPFLSLNIRS